MAMSTIALVGIAASCLAQEVSDKDINRLVGTYSTQRVVAINLNETVSYKLKSGAERVIRLVSVKEQRDSVAKFVRRADVRVESDGRPLDLVCAPYVMPTETRGLRILVDTTSGWGNVSRRAQLSLWDAGDPIVDTKRFGFPLRNFRLFSHASQAYNEPVHLGAGDGDQGGARFYHDYGFDMAGYEGRVEVVSATAGRVVLFWPSRENICSVVIQDDGGFHWEYAHLNSFAPEIVLNARVALGQKLGMLGRSGPSGNFSHSHLGSYLTRHDLDVDNRDKRLNLYPWLVAAYQAQHPRGLAAIARPHHQVLVGEDVDFDGSNSLAWGGGKIGEWRWVFPDGQTVRRAKARKKFNRAGAYVATLWVKDDKGGEDVDFCQVKVYSRPTPEPAMPHIFMTYTPTQNIRPNQAVTFRFWFQGSGGGLIKVDFDDETRLSDYQPYAELQHAFKTPGIHVVTAQCEAAGKPVTQKLKVVVETE